MQTRKASIKETGEELPNADWERFDKTVADLKDERGREKRLNAVEERARDINDGDQDSSQGQPN